MIYTTIVSYVEGKQKHITSFAITVDPTLLSYFVALRSLFLDARHNMQSVMLRPRGHALSTVNVSLNEEDIGHWLTLDPNNPKTSSGQLFSNYHLLKENRGWMRTKSDFISPKDCLTLNCSEISLNSQGMYFLGDILQENECNSMLLPWALILDLYNDRVADIDLPWLTTNTTES